MQVTSKIFMVRPVRFGFNAQTADSNKFQKRSGHRSKVQEDAVKEFTSYTSLLKGNGINIAIAEDTLEPATPDSIFPNNWFSTHEDGTLVLYPMAAPNRREERKGHFLDIIKSQFEAKRVVDLTHYEEDGLFLEGTGSLVLDRVNKVAYACLSPRTNEKVLKEWCAELGYTPHLFNSYDASGNPIYHTNVMMSVGTQYAIVCLDSITDISQREELIHSLTSNQKKVLEISFEQMNHFAGNMLELKGNGDKNLLVMSSSARKSLTLTQSRELSKVYKLLSPSLETIETNGGGSARCMIAELF